MTHFDAQVEMDVGDEKRKMHRLNWGADEDGEGRLERLRDELTPIYRRLYRVLSEVGVDADQAHVGHYWGGYIDVPGFAAK